jgi:hypothetical protein
MMRAVKALIVVALLVMLARYFPVYYNASMFNDFVKTETERNHAVSQLQLALLQKAQMYFLPVKVEDIQIKEDGSLLRVNVNYHVPVDFVVFRHELSFHAAGAGLLSSQ